MSDTDIQWFAFNEPEAVGEVGVRRDQYGLGLYLREHPDPALRDGRPFQFAAVDLFYGSAEGRPLIEATVEPPVNLVIYDTASDNLAGTAQFLPKGTVLELEQPLEIQQSRKFPHLMLVTRKEGEF